ncbi:hypothetical protein K501DRAFT_283175 [Backusella circina FSU 941]|nr:hypothetical protein K501DRAFT_283175 [Backusella circina FSU 941]
MGIRIASRPTFMQTYPPAQSTHMYGGMSYAPSQASSSPVVIHQERTYYNSPTTHSAMHDYGLPSPHSMVSSEQSPIQFVRDIGGLKDPTLNRQVLSFLPGNKQSTPYHYTPYSEEEIQWGNKANSSPSPSNVAIHPGGNRPHGNQVSSPTSSVASSDAAAYHRKDARLDIAKNIKITSYKQTEDDSDDEEQHHRSVIRRVTLSSNRSDSSRYREHSNEDGRNRSRQSSSGSGGDNESSHGMRQNDFYVPDYEQRPLPPRAALTGRIRHRERSVSPDRSHHRSNRNSSRSPTRRNSRSSTTNGTSTNINDRLNMSQVTTTTSSSTGAASHNRENSRSSTLYQHKSWVNPSDKLPLSKKFTPREAIESESSQNHAASSSTTNATRTSYNKIWVKPTNDVTTTHTVSKTPQGRDLRYKEPISREPLSKSKKFSSDMKSAPGKPSPAANPPAAAAAAAVPSNKQDAKSTLAKPKEKPKVIANANKQNNVPSSSSSSSSSSTTTKSILTKPVQPKATSVKPSVAHAKPSSTVSNTTITSHSVADPSANLAAGTPTTPKASSKESLPSCSQTIPSINDANQHCTFKEEPGTREMKLSDFSEHENNDMDIDENKVVSHGIVMANPEKRLSETRDVPGLLLQPKKRRVSTTYENESNGVIHAELRAFSTNDLMEVDSVQNNVESTCSSSSSMDGSTTIASNGVDTAIYTPTSSSISNQTKSTTTPMVTHTITDSSYHLNIPSNKTLNNLTRSTAAPTTTTFEKEDILEQIFGDGYSRDVTPEVTAAVGRSSLMKKSHVKNVAKLREQVATHGDDKNTNTTTHHQLNNNISNQMASSSSDTAIARTTVEVITNDKMNVVAKNNHVTEIQMNPSSLTGDDNISHQQQVSHTHLADNNNRPPLSHPFTQKITISEKVPKSQKQPHDTSPMKNSALPTTIAPPKKSRLLPKPWILRMSDTGDIYYFNTETQESTDVKPVL